jgi:hypothetical protein
LICSDKTSKRAQPAISEIEYHSTNFAKGLFFNSKTGRLKTLLPKLAIQLLFIVAKLVHSGHWRNRSESTLVPRSRRSPTDLTLISCASAAKVGLEPISLKKSLLLALRIELLR